MAALGRSRSTLFAMSNGGPVMDTYNGCRAFPNIRSHGGVDIGHGM